MITTETRRTLRRRRLNEVFLRVLRVSVVQSDWCFGTYLEKRFLGLNSCSFVPTPALLHCKTRRLQTRHGTKLREFCHLGPDSVSSACVVLSLYRLALLDISRSNLKSAVTKLDLVLSPPKVTKWTKLSFAIAHDFRRPSKFQIVKEPHNRVHVQLSRFTIRMRARLLAGRWMLHAAAQKARICEVERERRALMPLQNTWFCGMALVFVCILKSEHLQSVQSC